MISRRKEQRETVCQMSSIQSISFPEPAIPWEGKGSGIIRDRHTKTVCRPYCVCDLISRNSLFLKLFGTRWNSTFTILFLMSVENISLFNSVLDEALERLGNKNLKLNECQYEAVKAVVVDRKDTICILPSGYTHLYTSFFPSSY